MSAPKVGRLAELGHLAVELGRGRHEHDLAVAVVLDALHVAVGQRLRVVLDLAGGERHVPLAVLLGQQLLPLGEGLLGEQLLEQPEQRLPVLLAGGRVGEALVGEPVEACRPATQNSGQ